MTHNTEKKTYVDLLRERAADMAWQLDRLCYKKDMSTMNAPVWRAWLDAVLQTDDIRIETLEEICRELACQFLAFSNSRPKHLTILSAFRDREECIAEENAALLRIKRACEPGEEPNEVPILSLNDQMKELYASVRSHNFEVMGMKSAMEEKLKFFVERHEADEGKTAGALEELKQQIDELWKFHNVKKEE